MKKIIEQLNDNLQRIEEEYGGDVISIPTITEALIEEKEEIFQWKLPSILKKLYLTETNGLRIGNKVIYSLQDKKQKKTLIDSLERNNNSNTSYWFKGRPEIFRDYLVIGADGEVCFCFSRKYEYDNPSIYICENPNSNKGVDFERLNLDLNGLISVMIEEEFE